MKLAHGTHSFGNDTLGCPRPSGSWSRPCALYHSHIWDISFYNPLSIIPDIRYYLCKIHFFFLDRSKTINTNPLCYTSLESNSSVYGGCRAKFNTIYQSFLNCFLVFVCHTSHQVLCCLYKYIKPPTNQPIKEDI